MLDHESPLTEGDKVYVRDVAYAWLPAKILQRQNDRVLVEIELPNNWSDSTTVSEGDEESSSDERRTSSSSSSKVLERRGTPPLELHGEQRWIRLDDYKDRLLPRQNIRQQAARDMAELPYLHEAAILYQIKQRHFGQMPYTRVGDIIMAVNPCQWIKPLYTREQRRLYAKSFVWQIPDCESSDQSVFEEKKEDDFAADVTTSSATTSCSSFTSIYDQLGFEPHIYEVAALAYRGLFLERRNQTILVSGESGAGKTETVKIVLKQLATLETLAMTDIPEDDVSVVPASNNLVRHIVESSPLFEAFGNAKTLRNHNSSRFGKMTRLHFGFQSTGMCGLRGSSCETYLLETNRVVSQAAGERNFHIFYQLLAAPQEYKRQLLAGSKDNDADDSHWANLTPADFAFLNGSSQSGVDGELEYGQGMSDSALWNETLRALEFFQWTGDKLETLLRALGIILRLGNVVFVDQPDGEGCTVAMNELALAADALGIPVAALEKAMTHRVIETACDRVEVPLKSEKAKDYVDALVKKIYVCIFDSIVRTINEQTHDTDIDENDGEIILLDLYGFESFGVNRFEQLCINYANEKLHKKYVDDNFRRVKAEYESEGIEVFDFQVVDNSDVLAIFEGRSGLICAINEECILPNGSSENYVQKVKKMHRSSKRFINKKLFSETVFGVSHFAGQVVYNAEHFVERNTDKLPETLVKVVANTSNTLLKDALRVLLEEDEVRKSFDTGKMNAAKKCVFEKFRVELKELVSCIEETKTRYIRCIKPNEQLSPNSIDHLTVMRQLKCAGLVAAIDLSRETYPNKLTFRAAEERFKCLLTNEQIGIMRDLQDHDRAQLMMSVLFAPLLEVYVNCEFTVPYACGKTRIYYRTGALELLESRRHDYYSARAATIQRWILAKLTKLSYQRARKGATQFQATLRGNKTRSAFLKQKSSATMIQASVRCIRDKVQYRRIVASTVALQARCRTFLRKMRSEEYLRASIAVQSASRMHAHRKHFIILLQSAIVLQSFARHAQARKLLKDSREAAIRIQAIVRAIQSRWRLTVDLKHNMAALAIQGWAMDCLEEKHRRRNAAALLLQRREPNERSSAPPPRSSPKGWIVQDRHLEIEISLQSDDDQTEPSSDGSFHATGDDNAVPSGREAELLQQVASLQAELAWQREHTEELRGEIGAVVDEAETHKQVLESEFEERLVAYEEEVLQLKRTIRQNEQERMRLRDEVVQSQNTYLKNVQRLKRNASRTADDHKDHLKKILSVLEEANTARQAETDRIMDELETVKRNRDETVARLEAQLVDMNRCGSPSVHDASSERHTRHQIQSGSSIEVKSLERELTALIAPNNITELVDKSARHPWMKDAQIGKVSLAARKKISRLTDLALRNVERRAES